MAGGGSSSPPPPLSDTVPTKSDTEIQTEAAKARARLRKRQGRRSTFLSAGPGVAGDLDLTGSNVVQRPTLLGGGG